MRRYQDKIATILGMVVVISTLATGCGSAAGPAQNSSAEQVQETESDSIQIEQNTEESQLVGDPDLPKDTVLVEEYEDMQGIVWRNDYMSDVDLQYTLVPIKKKYHSDLADADYYVVTDEQGNEWKFSGWNIAPLDFVTGIVTEDTSVYTKPDVNSKIIDVGYGNGWDEIIEAGEVVDVDTEYENEEFYHVFWMDCEWDGYILKSALELVEGDGFLHGTIAKEDTWELTDSTGGKECVTLGEVEDGDSFIVLRSWLCSDFESWSYVQLWGVESFCDSYYILTEDGEFGYIPMSFVEIEE